MKITNKKQTWEEAYSSARAKELCVIALFVIGAFILIVPLFWVP